MWVVLAGATVLFLAAVPLSKVAFTLHIGYYVGQAVAGSLRYASMATYILVPAGLLAAWVALGQRPRATRPILGVALLELPVTRAGQGLL